MSRAYRLYDFNWVFLDFGVYVGMSAEYEYDLELKAICDDFYLDMQINSDTYLPILLAPPPQVHKCGQASKLQLKIIDMNDNIKIATEAL